MATQDVRLTATNPEDSSVVPVACNEKGELKLEEPLVVEFDGNLDTNLTVRGAGNFEYTVTRNGRNNIASFVSNQNSQNTFGPHYLAVNEDSVEPCFAVAHNGEITGKGLICEGLGITGENRSANVIYCNYTGAIPDSSPFLSIVRRGTPIDQPGVVLYPNSIYTSGTVTPSNVILNLEPDNDANYTTTASANEEGDTVEHRVYNGPTLDVKEEIFLIKAALREVMDKLRMTPPGGWEVWDGSSESS